MNLFNIVNYIALLSMSAGAAQNSPGASANQVQAIVSANKVSVPQVLMKVPISQSQTYTGGTGQSVNWLHGQGLNSDGSGLGLFASVPNTTGDAAIIEFGFYGTDLGLRWTEIGTDGFTVFVDGRSAVKVTEVDRYRAVENHQSGNPFEESQITHTGLSNGYHVARIALAQNQFVLFTGMLVDARQQPPAMREANTGSVLVAKAGPTVTAYSPLAVGFGGISMAWTTMLAVSNWTSSANMLYVTTEFPFTVSAATGNSANLVITTSSTHGLTDGAPVAITAMAGETSANWAVGSSPTVLFAKETGFTSTTFGVYSDAALTVPVTGNGTWTSGGSVYPLLGQFSVPANDCRTVSFVCPIAAQQFSIFGAAAGLTVLPFGGFYQ